VRGVRIGGGCCVEGCTQGLVAVMASEWNGNPESPGTPIAFCPASTSSSDSTAVAATGRTVTRFPSSPEWVGEWLALRRKKVAV
jgi:hypothetical protein